MQGNTAYFLSTLIIFYPAMDVEWLTELSNGYYHVIILFYLIIVASVTDTIVE